MAAYLDPAGQLYPKRLVMMKLHSQKIVVLI